MLPENELPLRLEELAWSAIAQLQNEGHDFLILPLGATEQHGPHLPINTDSLIATRICEFASAKTKTPVLPCQTYTVSEGHTAKWPGTFSVRHETFIHLIGDLTRWVVATGWKRLLLVNSHFGNDASLRVAVDQLRLRHLGELQIGVLNTFQLSPEIWAEFTSDANDLHANKSETDLMLYLAPETVRMDRVEDDPDRTEGTVFSYPVSQTSLNGLTGKPSLGNVEDGERLFLKMGNRLAELVERAKTESPPLEPELWQGTSA
ncbi:MAG: creatininase family protein [Verrucomicrobiota bacterium]